MTYLPTLVVVSGPAGAGKTTLAHKIAQAIGCPAVCRDEIKEGMMHAAAPGFVPGLGDELTMRTLPVFFDVLGLQLNAGVTTIAEAAFQDRRWRAGLEPLRELAQLRIVHCTVSADVAFQRSLRRRQAVATRRAHADPGHPTRPGTPQDTTLSSGCQSMLRRSTSTPPTAIGPGSGRSWQS